jgi:hypothetical protein
MQLEAGHMKAAPLFIALLFLVVMACTTFAEKSRMESFNDTARIYRWALLNGDYKKAARYIDPEAKDNAATYDTYQNIKIVDYKVTDSSIADDHHRIEQEVELQYYLLDRNVLKTAQSRQVWQYQLEQKTWALETGLPLPAP